MSELQNAPDLDLDKSEETTERTAEDNADPALAPGSVVVPPKNYGFVEETQELAEKQAEEDNGEPQLVEKEYSIVNHLDPRRQADPHGVYLDDVQRQQAEIARARAEDREPDLDNPPPYAGDVIVQTDVAKADPNYVTTNYPVAFTADTMVGRPEVDTTAKDEFEAGLDGFPEPVDEEE